MKCACGWTLTAEMAEDNQQVCPQCGKPMHPELEELLTRPRFGIVREVRPQQVELATALDQTMRKAHGVAYAEGQCGVGKTFSYGVPALMSQRRFIVSTAKKTLQDQLEGDLPFLKEKLRIDADIVSIKGKANYICRRQLQKNKVVFEATKNQELYHEIEEFLEKSPLGDRNDFTGNFDWPATLCTAEDCSGCGRESCGYAALKERLKTARVIITNHSLVGFDIRLGMGKLFGGPYDMLIVDEGHAFPEAVRRAFSKEVSSTWCSYILKRLKNENINLTLNETNFKIRWKELFDSLPDARLLTANCFSPGLLQECVDFLAQIRSAIIDHLESFGLHPMKRATFGKDASRPNNAQVPMSPEEIIERMEEMIWQGDGGQEEHEILRVDYKLYKNVYEKEETLIATTQPDDNFINCREESSGGTITLVRQPVELAPYVRGPLSGLQTFIVTSATLDFKLLEQELGVKADLETRVASPFNFELNARLYIPKHLPRPGEEEYLESISKEIVQLARISKGNAFILFTSKLDLAFVEDYIHENVDFEYPIIAQREKLTAQAALDKFQRTDHSVLFGLKSFFEGVDIPGQKLRLVVITKIPFPQFGDPLAEAKKKTLGKKWWNFYYVPRMMVDLQQAAGRLLRSVTDKGVVAILDSRIWTGARKEWKPTDIPQKHPWSGYGKEIVDLLPFKYTYRLELIEQFFNDFVLPFDKEVEKKEVEEEEEAI